MLRLRHQDQVLLGCDTNLDLTVPCDGSLPSITARCIMEQFGLIRSNPLERTWWNFQSSGKLDYVLQAGSRRSFLTQSVDEPIGRLLRTDHALVSATIRSLRVMKLPRKRRYSKCAKWQVNAGSLVHECNSSSEDDVLRARRPIERLQRLSPPEELLNRLVVTKAKLGDYSAISYMKRRQSMGHTHSSYMLRAGGEHRAVSDVKVFYEAKYCCDKPHDSELTLHAVLQHSQGCCPPEFTFHEVMDVLTTMKHGKSCGHSAIQPQIHCA